MPALYINMNQHNSATIHKGPKMEGEMQNYTKAWLQVILSLCYCFAIAKLAPKGIPRLLAILPVNCLFLALPLSLHTLHLGGSLAFFISWLANFKLLLFAFDKGPLSHPSLSLSQFLALASLPVMIQQKPNSHKPHDKRLLGYALKALVFAAVVRAYHYTQFLHLKVLLSLYSAHMYLILETSFNIIAHLVRTLVRIELEPQFNEPFLSTSLQDFWSRRWNLVVVKTLRPTVYEPVLHLAQYRLGRSWASLLAVWATFLVSGLMHELIFYFLGRAKPTWEVTRFFLLHGFCLLVEMVLKTKLTGKFRLPKVASVILTMVFLMNTAFWLFFPQLLRCNSQERALQEYAALGAFVRNVGGAFRFKPLNTARFFLGQNPDPGSY